MSGAGLILETSGRTRIGVAIDGVVTVTEDLGGGRQQNRHLLPTVERLLRTVDLTPRSLSCVVVSIGPGSYTGLRVGITAAKTLAYTLGCSLVAVPTFAAIAAEVPGTVDVFADALQGAIYVQRFTDGVALDELRIERFDEWVTTAGVVAGHGVITFADKLSLNVTRSTVTEPSVAAVLRVADMTQPLSRDELMRLEPLYLRGSSAEEKAKKG
jgi:tRNA threonylcarbamoyladenosine biosynthesis protein TsaB